MNGIPPRKRVLAFRKFASVGIIPVSCGRRNARGAEFIPVAKGCWGGLELLKIRPCQQVFFAEVKFLADSQN